MILVFQNDERSCCRHAIVDSRLHTSTTWNANGLGLRAETAPCRPVRPFKTAKQHTGHYYVSASQRSNCVLNGYETVQV